jgi:hypothetical protein
VGTWLPEPIVTLKTMDPVELSESLTIAFVVLLEGLTPVERAGCRVCGKQVSRFAASHPR